MQIWLTYLPRSVMLRVNSFCFMPNYVLNPAGSFPCVGGRSITNAVLHKTNAVELDRIMLA